MHGGHTGTSVNWGYNHRVVKHFKNFVNSENNEIQTQSILGQLKILKFGIPKYEKENLRSYIFMIRCIFCYLLCDTKIHFIERI